MHQHSTQIDRRGFIAGAAAATALVAAAPLASKAHADEAGRPASMEVYIIDNGEMTLSDSQMYQGGDGSLTTFPMYTVLIKHPEATVLFDAAKNTYVDRNAPLTFDLIDIAPEQEYPACLEALGLTPDDIDILVLSHLHGDHMGYADLFTNAKVYVAEREFEYTARGLGEGVMPGADDLNAMYSVPLSSFPKTWRRWSCCRASPSITSVSATASACSASWWSCPRPATSSCPATPAATSPTSIKRTACCLPSASPTTSAPWLPSTSSATWPRRTTPRCGRPTTLSGSRP